MVNDKDVLADSKNNSVEVKPLDQKPTVPLTPDLKAYDDSETDDWFAAGTPLWKRWLRYAGTGIVVLLVVVLLGRTVHHVINSNKKSNTVATKTTQVTSGASTTSSAGRSAATQHWSR